MNGATRAAQRWPDFLIIGAPKAGSTALFTAIARHPRVFASPIKEPRFFCHFGRAPGITGPGADQTVQGIVWNEARYLQLFAGCPPGSMAGEASVDYLHNVSAPANVRARIPDVRLIALLRHPVDRAYSQFLHQRHRGYEPLENFEDAWNAGPERVRRGWQPAWLFKERGFYGEQLERWLAHFSPEQIQVLFYEDWIENPEKVLNEICAHLGLDNFEQPRVTYVNVSSRQPRWKWLHHRMVEHNAVREWAQRKLPLWARDAITRSIESVNLRPGPPLDPELRTRLARTYDSDIRRLEKITGRNLDHWKSTTPR